MIPKLPGGVTYLAFLTVIIEEGIEAAKVSYSGSARAHKLAGALDGFNSCRNLIPLALWELLNRQRAETMKLREHPAHDDEDGSKIYWQQRCKEAEVEWVCNVVSAMLVANGFPATIVPPTARGYLMAERCLKIAAGVAR